MRNPFTPRSVPWVLRGRDREVAFAVEHLEHVSIDGEVAPNLFVLTGPRGVGKTSVLRHVAGLAAQEGFLTAWVSGYQDRPILPEIEAAISEALLSAGVTAATAPATTVAATEKMLATAARLAAGHGGGHGVGLALFIDELHAVAKPDLALLLNAVQNLTDDSSVTPLAVLGAGLPSVMGVVTAAATFGERSRFLEVPLLDPQSSLDVVVATAEYGGAAMEPAAARLIARAAGGYPYLLQLYGDHAWRQFQARAGEGSITLADAEAALRTAEQDIAATHRARWDAATPAEQRFLLAMVDAMRASGADTARRADIAERLGVESVEISALRSRLMNKAIIEASGRGHLRFCMDGFADFVANT